MGSVTTRTGTRPLDPLEAWPTADLARPTDDAVDAGLAWPDEAALAAAAAMDVAEVETPTVAADADVEPALEAGVAEPIEAIDAVSAATVADPDTDTREHEAAAAALLAHAVADAESPAPETAAADATVDEPAEPALPAVAGPASIDPADIPGRADAAAAQTTDLLRRFRPGQSLDDEIAAYERDHGEVGLAAAAVVGIDGVSDDADLAPTGVPTEAVDADEAQRDRAAAAAAAALAAGAAATRSDDVVAQPTWRIVAPDAGPTEPSPEAPAEPDQPAIAASAEPAWPTQPEWPEQRPMAGGLPFLDRPPVVTGGIEQLWAESAREVVAVTPQSDGRAAGGVQPCVSCGLSLSATARFCRRCGSRQG